MSDYLHHLISIAPALLNGAWIAVAVVVAAETIGITVGLMIALMRLSTSRWLSVPALVYVDLIRGTPMLVQILFLYFGLPALVTELTGGRFIINPYVAGVLALGFNSAAYVSEIYRTAIGSLDKGQSEAARALGLTRVQTMRYVIFPQAFRWAVPPLGNEFITLLKDTSLLSVIGVIEILKAGQLYAARTYAVFPSYLGVAIMYIILTISIANILRVVERKLKVPA
jgi:His/Glu/Gln/Arg/opine family amino acid ABC transporter permease subunit